MDKKDEINELAMNIYLSENLNRKEDCWRINGQGMSGAIYRQQAVFLLSKGYGKKEV